MTNIKYQNYLHFKLPITANPLDYGKLIEQFDSKYIIQLNTSNVIIINEIDNANFIKLYRNGELMFEFKDSKSSIENNSFIRTIRDNKFTFKNGKLISTEVLSVNGYITIYSSYKDTDALLMKNSVITPFSYKNYLINLIENSYIYKNKKAELFILFKLSLIFLLFLLLFVIFPESNEGKMALAAFSTKNIIKLRKRQSIHNWNIKEFNLDNLLFTKDIFKLKLDLFWEKASLGFTKNNHMFILFKVKYNGSDFTTIGNLQRLNVDDKDWYLNWIINNMIMKSEYYNETGIESLIFSYGFKDEKLSRREKFSSNVNFQHYKNNNLVISYNPLDYGKLITKIKFENYTQFILQTSENLLVKINQFDKYNEIELISGGDIIFTYKDEWISENKFVRNLDNKNFYFENNKEILFTKEMKSNKFIPKLAPTKNLINKFITLDVETFIKDSILIVYCISIYDGKEKSNFYLSNYKNVDELIITALKSIMIRKYNGYNVYIHNMAKFDIIFLLKYLVELGVVDATIHNQRILNINFNFGKDNQYQIHFRDSYLLLLHSLSKLCKSFSVKNPKTVFPIFFVNEDNLDYIGKVPDIKYFKNINKNDYENYKSKFNENWSLKNEAIKYCNLDCISLHQVVFKFTEMIFNLFNRNVHHYTTLPSLAFAIFRSKFMKEENIPQLSGKIAKDIRQGYTGGSCDVFIPQSKVGKKIKCYDVNSLYPFIMWKSLLPIGTPTYFMGDIFKINPNAFGFFYCKIIAPDNIKHPILQTHVKTNAGVRTLSPIGKWEDMLFSEEMKNAQKYGYKIEVLWGYTFEKNCIFKDYVEYLYAFRLNYPKTDPMNFLAKILLNSLYGRFGMDDNFSEINIIHKDYYPDFENKYLDQIIETKDLGNYKLVTYKLDKDENEDQTHFVSIGVASAITAYSRIHMTQFKNNPKINLYYTDTDSIYTDSDIDTNLIDSKVLGKLKLEYICNKAIFLAPKVYCLDTQDIGFIYKIKGLKHEVELAMSDFEKLLFKQSFLTKVQTKFSRNISEGNIKLLEQVYTLQVTDNKRNLVYNKNNKWISTKAYKISNIKEIK